MASRFITPVFQALDDSGKSVSGAQLFFFEVGSSTTLKDTFTDDTELTANSNPVIADGSGIFPNIYGTDLYRVVLKHATTGPKKNAQIWERDNVVWTDGTLLQGDISEFTNLLFDGVSDAVAAIIADADILIGSSIKTNSYYNPTEASGLGLTWPSGGSGNYTLVAAGTGTDDGGEFIDVDATRQLQLIVNESVSAKQFGAAADGVIDDTTEFLATIASGKNILGSNTDIYSITSRLTFDQDNQQLFGGFTLLYTGANTDRLFDVTADNFTATNIIFDGDTSQVRFALGYLAKDVTDCSLVRCHFQNMRGTAKGSTPLNQQYGLCIDYDTVENVLIDGCTFRNLVSVNTTANGGAVEGQGFIGGIVVSSEDGRDPTVPQTFPSYGKIVNTTFDKIITELDSGISQVDRNTFDDGDGIRFYGVIGISDRGNFAVSDSHFNQCSKRAIKSAMEGVTVKDIKVVADSNVLPMTTVVKIHSSNNFDGVEVLCDLVANQPDLLVQVFWIQTVDNDEGIHINNITSPFADIVFDFITNDTSDVVTNVFLDNITCPSVTTRVFSQSGATPTSAIIKVDNVDVIGVGATTKGVVPTVGAWNFGRVKAKNMDWKGISGGSIDNLELTLDSGVFTGTGSDALVELNGVDVGTLTVNGAGLPSNFLDGTRSRIILLQGDSVNYKHLDITINEAISTSKPHFDIMGDDVTISRFEYDGPGLADVGTLITSDGIEIGTCVRKGTSAITSPFIIAQNAASDNIVIGQCTDFRATSVASIRLFAGLRMVVANVMSRSTLQPAQDDTAGNMIVVNSTTF